MIPLRERLVAESQRFYNFMLIGVYQLLQAKQDEIAAYRGYIEAVRDYWVARSDLERAVGGRLPSAERNTSQLAPIQEESEGSEQFHR